MQSAATVATSTERIFEKFAFNPGLRPEIRPAEAENNIVAMPIPEHVTFDKGRCAAFVDRVMTHYEDGRLNPKLMLHEDRQVLDIISITPVLSSANAAMLKITCSNGDCKTICKTIAVSDNTHRLVQFRNHIGPVNQQSNQQKSELCLGWEDQSDKNKSGFIHFERPELRN